MSGNYKYLLAIIGFIVVIFLLWFLRTVVAYILIAALLSLLGKPIVRLLKKIKIGRFHLPVSLCSVITLILLLAFFLCFFVIFIPIVVQQGSELSAIDLHKVLASISQPLQKVQDFLTRFMISRKDKFSINDFLASKLSSFMNVSILTGFINDIVSFIGNIFVAVFVISFITFFFQREEKMFLNGILMFVPDKNEERVRSVISSIEELLIKYITRLGIRIIGMIILMTLGLMMAGIKPQTSLVIGLFNGIINIVPYVGPIIGLIFSLIVGTASNLQSGFTPELGSLVIYILIVFVILQSIDILLAPFIMSGSVKAHPLEFFLVTIIAGSLAGIGGMILAIPVYTVARVIAKEFLYQFKPVRKITKNL